jgi:hypothetical protein
MGCNEQSRGKLQADMLRQILWLPGLLLAACAPTLQEAPLSPPPAREARFVSWRLVVPQSELLVTQTLWSASRKAGTEQPFEQAYLVRKGEVYETRFTRPKGNTTVMPRYYVLNFDLSLLVRGPYSGGDLKVVCPDASVSTPKMTEAPAARDDFWALDVGLLCGFSELLPAQTYEIYLQRRTQ